MLQQESKNLAGFWDRVNFFTIFYVLFIGTAIDGFSDYLLESRVGSASQIIFLFGIAVWITFLFIRRKFIHMTLVDVDGKPVSLLRRLGRLVLTYIPLIIWFGISVYVFSHGQTLMEGLWNIDWNIDDANDFVQNEMQEVLNIALFMQTFLYTLPFLMCIYVLDWIPFFIKKYRRPAHDIVTGVRVVYSSEQSFSILRIIFKIPLYVMSVITLGGLFVTSLWVLYNIPDQALKPEAEAFFQENEYPFENNVHIAWAGLNAPAGVKDIYEYGLKVTQGKIKGARHIEFVGEVEDKYDFYNDDREVPPKAYVEEIYSNNKELIERYIGLYSYKNYGSSNTLGGHAYGQDLIEIHRFLPLYWEYLAREGQGEKAIEWWLKDMAFLQGMMGVYGTLVEKAIFMVQYGLNLKALPLILEADPDLIVQYQSPIENMLYKDFLGDIWNVENTWKAEYNGFRDMQIEKLPHDLLILKPNATRNELYHLAQDMINLSKKPLDDLSSAYKDILLKYECFANGGHCFIYNVSPRMMYGGFVKGGEMYENAYDKTAHQRVLILWVRAHAENLETEDMSEFLKRSDESLYDPFIDAPFRWDAKKNAIYFVRDSDDPEERVEILFLDSMSGNTHKNIMEIK